MPWKSGADHINEYLDKRNADIKSKGWEGFGNAIVDSLQPTPENMMGFIAPTKIVGNGWKVLAEDLNHAMKISAGEGDAAILSKLPPDRQNRIAEIMDAAEKTEDPVGWISQKYQKFMKNAEIEGLQVSQAPSPKKTYTPDEIYPRGGKYSEGGKATKGFMGAGQEVGTVEKVAPKGPKKDIEALMQKTMSPVASVEVTPPMKKPPLFGPGGKVIE